MTLSECKIGHHVQIIEGAKAYIWRINDNGTVSVKGQMWCLSSVSFHPSELILIDELSINEY